MNLSRRGFLHLAAGAVALPAASRFAWAQTYPSRPVRWVVGFPAGGAADIVARLLGQWLSDRLGQPVIIENRPGAGSNTGTEVVVRATPDGYTLLAATATNTINAALYKNLNFDFIRDISPVAGTIGVPLVMEVHPAFPAKTVPEFIAHAKANPGKINMASAGIGTSPHMAGELFKMMSGVDMIHVPYRGGTPALADLLGGQVQVYFSVLPESIELVRSEKLRALAVTTVTRSEALPDVPSLGDFVQGYETSSWHGVGVPKNTPADIVEKLNREINAGLADSKIKARLAELGASPLTLSSSDFGIMIQQTAKWAEVIRAGSIKPE